MRISVAKRDGCACATGSFEDVVQVILLLSLAGALTRWTTAGVGRNVAFCWPLAGEEE